MMNDSSLSIRACITFANLSLRIFVASYSLKMVMVTAQRVVHHNPMSDTEAIISPPMKSLIGTLWIIGLPLSCRFRPATTYLVEMNH